MQERWLYLMKTDGSGNVLWKKSIGEEHYYRGGYCAQETSDGGIIIVGRYSYRIEQRQAYLLKTDARGNVIWEKTIGDEDSHEAGYYIAEADDGGFIIAGVSDKSILLAKTDAYGNIRNTRQILKSFNVSHNYPNPFNASTTIKYELKPVDFVSLNYVVIKIYNVLGNEIRTLVAREHSIGSHEVTWDGRDSNGNEVSSGIYFCQMMMRGFSTGKTIKIALVR